MYTILSQYILDSHEIVILYEAYTFLTPKLKCEFKIYMIAKESRNGCVV